MALAGQLHMQENIENEALFDAYGHPLASLKAYHYLRTGAKAPLKFSSVEKVEEQVIELGESYTLPSVLKATFNDDTTKNVNVTWNDKANMKLLVHLQLRKKILIKKR